MPIGVGFPEVADDPPASRSHRGSTLSPEASLSLRRTRRPPLRCRRPGRRLRRLQCKPLPPLQRPTPHPPQPFPRRTSSSFPRHQSPARAPQRHQHYKKAPGPGDGVYLSSTFPVIVGNRVVIPPRASMSRVLWTALSAPAAALARKERSSTMHFTSMIFPNGSRG